MSATGRVGVCGGGVGTAGHRSGGEYFLNSVGDGKCQLQNILQMIYQKEGRHLDRQGHDGNHYVVFEFNSVTVTAEMHKNIQHITKQAKKLAKGERGRERCGMCEMQ